MYIVFDASPSNVSFPMLGSNYLTDDRQCGCYTLFSTLYTLDCKNLKKKMYSPNKTSYELQDLSLSVDISSHVIGQRGSLLLLLFHKYIQINAFIIHSS